MSGLTALTRPMADALANVSWWIRRLVCGAKRFCVGFHRRVQLVRRNTFNLLQLRESAILSDLICADRISQNEHDHLELYSLQKFVLMPQISSEKYTQPIP